MKNSEYADLLKKLNYREQKRIAVINSAEPFVTGLRSFLNDVVIDTSIDPRFPYEFIMIYVRFVCEIEPVASSALHNLTADGILWFTFPKKTSRKFSSDLDRDHGWEFLNDRGFDRVRQVSVDDDWTALRFRNMRFIRSARKRENR
ncbi:MAG: hypothetical protein U0X39_11235 [Bacteroidales bacterium]